MMHFNNGDFDKIFQMFNEDMKQAVPLDDLIAFLSKIDRKYGKLKQLDLSEFFPNDMTVYKATFEKDVKAFRLALDNQDKIAGFIINQFVEPSLAVNDLGSYPKNISDIIFTNVKNFPMNAQFSIAMVDGEKVAYYGILLKDGKVQVIENQKSVFEIGSITKVFTSTLLAKMVNEGKVKLDGNINPYYDFTFNKDIELTFESLSNHTSGLPRLPLNMNFLNNENPFFDYDSDKMEDYLKTYMQLATPGECVYSNGGVGILGYTLGVSQNKKFEDLLKTEILEKYGMMNSHVTKDKIEGTLVKGINQVGEEVSNWDFGTLFGAGGLMSSTEDLSKFAIAQFNAADQDLALTRKATFKVNDEMSIGLGWHILAQKDGSSFHWHNGGTGGYSSSMAVDVEHKKAVIILSNISAFHPLHGNIDDLCFALMQEAKE